MLAKNIYFIFFLIIFSCDKNRYYDEYKTIPYVWNKDSLVSFNFKVIDSSKLYNSFINIRTDNNYKFNNLFLIVSLSHDNTEVFKDTLEYSMASSSGELLGKNFLNTYENKLWHKENFMFFSNGNYMLTIQHAMRKINQVDGLNQLEGITNIGYRIEKIRN